MRRWRLTSVVPVLVLGLVSGCSSDEVEGSDPSSSESSSPEPTPTVEPATGPLLTQREASLRLPEGWADEKFPGSIQRVGGNPEDSSMIFLSQFRALGSEDKSLADLAETAAADGYDGQGTIEEDTVLQDVPVYHVTGQVNGKDTEAFGTLVDRDLVVVKFIFDEGVRDELQEEIIAEVFAGFEWKP